MLPRPSLLMPVAVLPMCDCNAAAPNKQPELQPVRDISHIADRVSSAAAAISYEAKEHTP